MTLSTTDWLFGELLANDAAPSPEQTVAFIVGSFMERAVPDAVVGVDMTRVGLHAWAEALRNPEIADRIARTHLHARRHYAEVARRWQAAGHLDPAAEPEDVGAVLQGIVQTFLLHRLIIPGTDAARYLSGVRGRS